ncbi:transmembrane protein, putative [Medicago truncatula]|uniref:Transmembrane protein, putative n=1 Tax=Medicago truncatula TaxID=3880 RepID=A0A072UG48_MEDTR|nr:transmembrane protein, putative [Medicago truncatula]
MAIIRTSPTVSSPYPAIFADTGSLRILTISCMMWGVYLGMQLAWRQLPLSSSGRRFKNFG